MLNFDVNIDKPDHDFMIEKAEEWARRGFLFDPNTWQDMIEIVEETEQQLLKLGLKNPNSDKEVEHFLQSFNSLEIASALYDINRGRWNLSVNALQNVAKKYTGILEIDLLAEYKAARATASAFVTLARHLTEDNRAFPKVDTTLTNRVMFVQPNITGLPKSIRPFLPLNPKSVLISVDIKAQEPSLIIYFYGSDKLKEVLLADDPYLGIAQLAFGPLKYGLTDGERAEVKKVWNVTAYGGSYATVKSMCKLIDAETLSRFIRAEIQTKGITKNSLYTCFGTKLVRNRGKSWSSVLLNTIIQGTGADIMALLVENFYAIPEAEREGIDIYFTRYDEVVLEVTEKCIEKNTLEGVLTKIQSFFAHTINNELKFKIEAKLF